MTPDDIELATGNIVETEYDPTVVRGRIQAFLASLPTDDETMGAVLHRGREVASARHHEFGALNPDMERVVGVMDAQIEPMIKWLEANGLPDARRHVFGREWWKPDYWVEGSAEGRPA
jgi:hypothetical protein